MNQRTIDVLSAGLLLALGVMNLGLVVLIAAAFLGFGGLFAVVAIQERDLAPLLAGGFFGGMGVIASVVLLAQALPSIIGGIALFWGKDWGRVLGILAGALALANFPVGTILGGAAMCLLIYGWATKPKHPVAPAAL